MKIKQVNAMVSRIVNLGNYESIKIESGGLASVEAGETLGEVLDILLDEISCKVKERTNNASINDWQF